MRLYKFSLKVKDTKQNHQRGIKEKEKKTPENLAPKIGNLVYKSSFSEKSLQ